MTTDAPSPASLHAYSDGHPLDQVHYREYKLILQPGHFTSPRSFTDFTRLVRHAAEQLDVALFREERPQAQYPRGPLLRYPGVPPLQRQVHAAPAHRLP